MTAARASCSAPSLKPESPVKTSYLALAILFGAALPGLAQTGPPLESGAPVITRIQVGATTVELTVQVPAGLGIKKVTIESRARFFAGAWVPRAVERLSADGGTVSFTLPRCPAVEMLRARADDREALPAAFYRGTNQFGGSTATTQGPIASVGPGIPSNLYDGRLYGADAGPGVPPVASLPTESE